MARFNVGDRVRCTSYSGINQRMVGRCGTIINIIGNIDNILVEFDEYISGHKGDFSDIKGEDGHCWWLDDYELEPYIGTLNKIVITTDGKTTTAKMYRDKTLVKVETTKCHPHDKFDFNVGARIAFDRLVGAKTEESPKGALKIEIGKKYKLNDYDKVTDHIGISRGTWEGIQSKGSVTIKNKTPQGNYVVDGGWCIAPEAFECEWVEPTYYNGKVVCVKTRLPIGLRKGKIYTFIDGTATNDWGSQVTRDRVVDFNDLVSRFPTVEWLEVVE